MYPHLFNINKSIYTPFFLIAGPCVVESATICTEIADTIYPICAALEIPYIFKASYKKANRTNVHSFTGIGDNTALNIIKNIGDRLNILTTTDIHTNEEAALAAQYVDILQIPAFLCRQTDLLLAAAKTNKIVNIKKGQFLNAESMHFAIQKIQQANNPNVMVTERGNSFGYQDLVVDFRNIKKLSQMNVPVIMDCTHSLQQPNQPAGVTRGTPEFIETIAKAAIATGVDGIFIETHPNPAQAKSDGANMLPLKNLPDLLIKLLKIRKS
ncbi:MAG: 3-deoxy-8-phosphooctulonate synthase, partial [Sediminibacterium sp.]|nr:3-deoxy-8-phosphooctulonate synthase [Sediminibacterium sp.]